MKLRTPIDTKWASLLLIALTVIDLFVIAVAVWAPYSAASRVHTVRDGDMQCVAYATGTEAVYMVARCTREARR